MRMTRYSILAILAVLMVAGGCADRDGAGMKLFSGAKRSSASDDVVKVVCFFTANMWRSFDAAGDRNPEGFAFVMYLWSKKTGRGIYADGVFRTIMYRIERDDEGNSGRVLAHEWTASTAALPKRGESRLGFSYQPSLYWGDELDVFGAEVEIVVQFEAPDGRVVQSQTHRTKVPQRKG